MNKSSNLFESFVIYDDEINEDNPNDYSNLSSEYSRQINDHQMNQTRSLNNMHDDISLYEYEDEDGPNTKRITWEEWYLKKKINTLKNEKLMKENMKKKLEEEQKSRNKKVYTEEEKNIFLTEWMDKKKKKRAEYEMQLEKLVLEKEKKKEKEEETKQKAKENFVKWLEELNEKERLEKQRKKDEQEKMKLEQERTKLKRQEACKRLIEENKKKNPNNKIRPNSSKKATAVINGKCHSYYDWSTSPAPGYINKFAWQS